MPEMKRYVVTYKHYVDAPDEFAAARGAGAANLKTVHCVEVDKETEALMRANERHLATFILPDPGVRRGAYKTKPATDEAAA